MYSYTCLFLYLILAVFFIIKYRENSPVFFLELLLLC